MWSSSAFATTYYISTDSKASDTNTGLQGKPWKTFQHAVSQMLPGDVLMVKSGVYKQGMVINAVGLAKSGGESRPIVATIGDSTFLHSGIPALMDAVYNRADISVLLLDNHTSASW